MNKQLLATGIVLTTFLLPRQARAASFTGLNVFGDSLVDSGNLYNLTSALAPLGFPRVIPPSPPYNQNSTNGNLWVENLGDALNLEPTLITNLLTIDPSTLIPTLNPATPSPTEGLNLAFFGSLSSDVHNLDDDLQSAGPPISFLEPLFPGFQDQIALFASLTPVIPADPTALYAIWVGANDYLDVLYNELLLGQPRLGGLTETELTNDVTDNIVNGVAALAGLGAQEFLVVNLPLLGATPATDFLDQSFSAQGDNRDTAAELNQLSLLHNRLLNQKLAALQATLPNTKIRQLDVATLISQALANPAQFGFTNVEDSCLINFSIGFNFEGVCENPDEFLFWDDVHPTAAAHREITKIALATLEPDTSHPSSVPEPGAALGFLALGTLGMSAKVKASLQRKRA